MQPEPERLVTLSDGTTIVVRPLRPEDRVLLVEGFARLSAQSRYRRFLRPVTSLSDRELTYLTDVDHQDHYALGAVTLDGGTGAGVARYIRTPSEPTVAEAAVVVADEYQGRGIGTVLLRGLADAAHRNGIATLRGWVLGDNARILRPLAHIGARLIPDGGVLRVEVDVARVVDAPTEGGAS